MGTTVKVGLNENRRDGGSVRRKIWVRRKMQAQVATAALAAIIVFGSFGEASAQMGGPQAETNVIISIASDKVQGLANVLNDEQYTWRPDDGVRSVAELVAHIAGTNYWMMSPLGIQIPADAPVTADYNSVVAFETSTDREALIAHLAASFEFLEESIASVPDERLDEEMNIFGTPGTVRAYLAVTSAHLHEHLGQFIAYTRVNGVTPPWSS